MTNQEREQIIEIAIRDYKAATMSRLPIRKERIIQAVNDMCNVYIMCSSWRVKNLEELRQTILEAEAKYSFVADYFASLSCHYIKRS